MSPTYFIIIFQCSTQCAIGTKRRLVICSRVDEAGNFTIIDGEFCRYQNKPPTEAPCNEDSPCGRKLLYTGIFIYSLYMYATSV